MSVQPLRITWIDDIKGTMLLLVCLAHWETLFLPLSLSSYTLVIVAISCLRLICWSVQR